MCGLRLLFGADARMMLACRRPLARCHAGLRIFRGLTTSTTPIHSALEEAANTVAREPLLARLRSTFHPWPDVAAVVAPRELHYQVQSFAGTTGTVGALLSSVIGAALLADPPSYSADANQKHQAKEKHKLERPLLARLMGWRWNEKDRDDFYYVLLMTAFFSSLQTVLTSTMVMTNLTAIPVELTGVFVSRNAPWITLPALLIAPTCPASALCIALEAEFGEKISYLSWGGMVVMVVNSTACILSMLHRNHVMRTASRRLMTRAV